MKRYNSCCELLLAVYSCTPCLLLDLVYLSDALLLYHVSEHHEHPEQGGWAWCWAQPSPELEPALGLHISAQESSVLGRLGRGAAVKSFCLCNAVEVEIPCCDVLELLQGVSCQNWQCSGLQQYLIPSWACPFPTEKLNLAGRKSLKLLLSCIGPKSCSERDKKSGSCLIFRTIAFIWGNKLFPLSHQFCCRISTMSCQTSLSSFVAF